MSIKTYLKGAFGFSGFLDLAFLFMEEIWHDVEKGSGCLLSSITSQTFGLPPSNNGLVNLSGETILKQFFLDHFFWHFLYFPPKCIFPLCTMWSCIRFFYFDPKYTVQKPFWNKQVCPEFIKEIIETNPWHKYGVKSTLCNIVIKESPLLSHIFISTISVRKFNIFIHIFKWFWNKIRNLWHHVTRCSRI